jgi:hypothetical protein
MVPYAVSRRLSRITAGSLKWLVALSFLYILATPCFGLWLPWATEQDKVKHTLNEIYKALIANDREMLREYIVGDGTDQFIDYEQALIKRMKVKQYDCKPRSIHIDTGSGSWAFVDLERVATLENGETFTRRNMVALKKIAGLWRLLIDPRKKRPKKKDPVRRDAPPAPKASPGTVGSNGEPAGAAMSNVSSSGQEVK